MTNPTLTPLFEAIDRAEIQTAAIAYWDPSSAPAGRLSPMATRNLTAGWYYWDPEYPEEGSVGPFESWEQAARHCESESHMQAPMKTTPSPKESKQ